MIENIILCGCSYVWNIFNYIATHTCPTGVKYFPYTVFIGCTCDRNVNFGRVQIHPELGYDISEFNNIKYTNMSEAAANNNRTVRIIIELVSEVGLDNFNDTVFYVGWTDFVRFEVYNNLEEKYMRMGINKDYEDKSKHWKYYNKHYNNLDDRFRKYLEQILFLQLFFNDNNIKYVFFDSLNNLLSSYAKKYREKYKKIFSMIDLDKWAIGDDYYSFQSYLNTIEKFVNGNKHKYWKDDGHPNRLGCKKWLKVLNERAEKLYG